MFQLLLAPVHKVRYLLLGASQHLCGLPVAQFFKIDQKKCLPVFLFELAQCGVQLLVLGYPRNMDGTEGPRAEKCAAFGALLRQATGLEVILWDERRTTVSAAAILADNDTFGAKRKERLDSVSAAVILESFLNWRAHHPDEEPPELVRPEA